MGRTCTTHGGEPECIKIIDREVRLLGISTLKWKYNIKNGIYRNKMGRYGLDSSGRG
jgi:hypothetical protein